MKKNILGRVLAFGLMLAMAYTMTQNTVIKAAVESNSTEEDAVNIGNKEFTSYEQLQESLKNVADVQQDSDTGVITVTMQKNIVGRICFVMENAHIIFNGNGKTLSGGECSESISLEKSKNVTVELVGGGIYKNGTLNSIFVGTTDRMIIRNAVIIGNLFCYGSVAAGLENGYKNYDVQSVTYENGTYTLGEYVKLEGTGTELKGCTSENSISRRRNIAVTPKNTEDSTANEPVDIGDNVFTSYEQLEKGLKNVADVQQDSDTGVITVTMQKNIVGRICFDIKDAYIIFNGNGKTLSGQGYKEPICLENFRSSTIELVGGGIYKAGYNNCIFTGEGDKLIIRNAFIIGKLYLNSDIYAGVENGYNSYSVIRLNENNDDYVVDSQGMPLKNCVKDVNLYRLVNKNFAVVPTNYEHVHKNLTKVEAREATCTAEGNKEYYVCECGKWFSDKLATTETSEAAVKIEKRAHEYETEYTKDVKYHWKKCKNCDAVTEKQEHTSSGEATEENAETCTVCGYVIHEKLQKESSDSSMQWQTLNKAKVFTEKAFADYKAGKESGKSDIANVVAQALKENSLSNVAYEIISYEKTEPTSATEGKISGIVSLAIGGCSTQIPFDYVITKVAEPQKPAQITGKGAQTTDGQIKISWIKADGADGYRIYASACDGESNYKLIKDTKDLTGAIKNLNNKKSYKFYVVAYKNVDGKKVRICKSMIYHVVLSDSKYTNVKAIKVAKTSYTLNVGDKQKLNAKSVKQEKNKKLLTHAQEFRYSSSDTTVATVSKTGEITAKQSGSCIIYVVANNGVMKKIKVNVA